MSKLASDVDFINNLKPGDKVIIAKPGSYWTRAKPYGLGQVEKITRGLIYLQGGGRFKFKTGAAVTEQSPPNYLMEFTSKNWWAASTANARKGLKNKIKDTNLDNLTTYQLRAISDIILGKEKEHK